MITNTQIEQARSLWKQGYKSFTISKMTSIPEKTIFKYVGDLKNHYDLEIEAIKERELNLKKLFNSFKVNDIIMAKINMDDKKKKYKFILKEEKIIFKSDTLIITQNIETKKKTTIRLDEFLSGFIEINYMKSNELHYRHHKLMIDEG